VSFTGAAGCIPAFIGLPRKAGVLDCFAVVALNRRFTLFCQDPGNTGGSSW